MNAIVARYDADAADYARYWGPVLERTARSLLDSVEEAAPREWRADGYAGRRVLDVGAGTGTLVFAALERWAGATVVASDASSGMLEFALSRVEQSMGSVPLDRVEFVHAAADELSLPDASVDAAMSSFVLQLVPDRERALREIRRVLKPGAPLVYVTWLDRDEPEPFVAAEEFDEAVYDLRIEEPEYAGEPHAGDVPSPRAAADELRRAGFVRASARADLLIHEWTFETYLEYKLAYDERWLLSTLTDEQRTQLEANARRRLGALQPRDFRWQAPVVFARGYRPSDTTA